MTVVRSGALVLCWGLLGVGCSTAESAPAGLGQAGAGGGTAGDHSGGASSGLLSGGAGSGSGGSTIIEVGAAVCTTELSCVVRSGYGQDPAWLEQQKRGCEAFGFSRIDAEGTWEDGGECPEADYFASCVRNDTEEHHLEVSYDTTIEEMAERCMTSGGTWTVHDGVEPKAYHSVDAATLGPTILGAMHPAVVTDSIYLLCSASAPEGLVGITEYYNGATNLARYSHFVCLDGRGAQAPFHFTQSFSERFSVAADVPDPNVQLAILNSRGANYIFTGETCWNCGETFTYEYPEGPGQSDQVVVTDKAGAQVTLDLVTASPN